MNPVMGKSCQCGCTHAHTCKYSNTAAAGEGVEREDILSRWIRSMKVTPLSVAMGQRDIDRLQREGGRRSACPDKWLHFSPAILTVLTH